MVPPATAITTPAFGFLTAVEDSQHGFFGGYLVVSDRGRPLEFHCTTPVLASQAQQILYGVALRPYLLGELIGETLVAKAQLPVQTILTDIQEMQTLAIVRSEPVAWLTSSKPALSISAMTADQQFTKPELTLGNYRLLGSTTCDWQADWLRDTTRSARRAHRSIGTPLSGIREAIREAQRVTEPTGDDEHEPSAAA